MRARRVLLRFQYKMQHVRCAFCVRFVCVLCAFCSVQWEECSTWAPGIWTQGFWKCLAPLFASCCSSGVLPRCHQCSKLFARTHITSMTSYCKRLMSLGQSATCKDECDIPSLSSEGVILDSSSFVRHVSVKFLCTVL